MIVRRGTDPEVLVMSDAKKGGGQSAEPDPPEPPLERPTTDTKLISDMDVTDAAQAIRDALGPGHGRTEEGGSRGAGGADDQVDVRLDSVEERLERLSELEERFSRIERALEDLRAKLEQDD